MLNIRSEDYSSEDNKVISIIFSYHIYFIDYNINEIGNELLINEKNISSENKDYIEYKEDLDSKLKYMNPLKIFKLPLSFAGFSKFIIDFKKLNPNVSDSDPNLKYILNIKEITPYEVKIYITLQEDKSIVIYKFTDILITIPKIERKEIFIERTVKSKNNYIFLII